jgi:hypothetical protein
MELKAVKIKFENRNFWVRSEFIDNYDFNDAYLSYYKSFIKTNLLKFGKHRDLYVSDLVDLSSYLELFDDDIFTEMSDLLSQKRGLIVKSSVILYMEDRYENFPDIKIIEIFDNILKNKNARLLKNQVLLSFIKCCPLRKDELLKQLILSIKKTKDWRSVHKILFNLNMYIVDENHREMVVDTIRKSAKKNDFGEGVQQLIEKYA